MAAPSPHHVARSCTSPSSRAASGERRPARSRRASWLHTRASRPRVPVRHDPPTPRFRRVAQRQAHHPERHLGGAGAQRPLGPPSLAALRGEPRRDRRRCPNFTAGCVLLRQVSRHVRARVTARGHGGPHGPRRTVCVTSGRHDRPISLIPRRSRCSVPFVASRRLLDMAGACEVDVSAPRQTQRRESPPSLLSPVACRRRLPPFCASHAVDCSRLQQLTAYELDARFMQPVSQPLARASNLVLPAREKDVHAPFRLQSPAPPEPLCGRTSAPTDPLPPPLSQTVLFTCFSPFLPVC